MNIAYCPNNHLLIEHSGASRNFPRCDVCALTGLQLSFTCYPCNYDICSNCHFGKLNQMPSNYVQNNFQTNSFNSIPSQDLVFNQGFNSNNNSYPNNQGNNQFQSQPFQSIPNPQPQSSFNPYPMQNTVTTTTYSVQDSNPGYQKTIYTNSYQQPQFNTGYPIQQPHFNSGYPNQQPQFNSGYPSQQIIYNTNYTTYQKPSSFVNNEVSFKRCPNNHYLSFATSRTRFNTRCDSCNGRCLKQTWFCGICNWDLCVNCYDLGCSRPSKMLKVCRNYHMLIYTDCYSRPNVTCDICKSWGHKYQYTCFQCDYDMCLNCYNGHRNPVDCSIF